MPRIEDIATQLGQAVFGNRHVITYHREGWTCRCGSGFYHARNRADANWGFNQHVRASR